MKKQKRIKKIATLLCLGAFSVGVLFTPEATLHTQAARAETAQPYSDYLSWRIKIVGTSIYKRLYNASTGNWMTDWIYVGEVPN